MTFILSYAYSPQKSLRFSELPLEYYTELIPVD